MFTTIVMCALHTGSVADAAVKALMLSPRSLAQYIDHTLLRPEATEDQILKLCDEAMEYSFKTVCIERKWLKAATRRLGSSAVLPITVIGFPEGVLATELKGDEVKEALDFGAREVDMVLNRDWLKVKDYRGVFEDIAHVVKQASGVPVKVILETSELQEAEKIMACALSKAAGASFVKTSTGFSKGGATETDVRLMRQVVGEDMGVKASGGVRTYEDAVKMIRAGANRLGTSASVAIVSGLKGTGNY